MDLDDLVIECCYQLNQKIIKNIHQKSLLKDEQYFQAEVFRYLTSSVNQVFKQLTVKLNYQTKLLRYGYIDIAVVDTEIPYAELLFIKFIRRTKQHPGEITNDILQMAAMSNIVRTLIITISDDHSLARLDIESETVLSKKRKMIFHDKITENFELHKTNDFAFQIEQLSQKLHLANKVVPMAINVESLRQFRHGRREKDRFAIGIYNVEIGDQNKSDNESISGKSCSTFMTEYLRETSNIKTYQLFTRTFASGSFFLRAEKMTYMNSELCIGLTNKHEESEDSFKKEQK